MSEQALNKAVIDLENIKQNDLDLDSIYDKLPEKIKSHSFRVSLYGNILYKKALEKKVYKEDYFFNQDKLLYIKDAFRYHDIGKVLLPQRVLVESDDETLKYRENIIHKHPSCGCRIFESLMDDFDSLSRDKQKILYLAQEVAIAHHEKWDGTGYPESLKQTEINVLARVCSIVNAYDSYVTNDNLTHTEAVNKIQASKSTSFDPLLVDVFTEVANDIFEISQIIKKSETSKDVNDLNALFDDEDITKLLQGANGRIRSWMKFNPNLFKEGDELRPIEFLYNRVVDSNTGYLEMLEANVVINDPQVGTLFPPNYDSIAALSNRLAKLDRWAIMEVGAIHESWEIKFARDIKFVVHLSVKILTSPDTLVKFIGFLNRLNLDSSKIIFELQIDDLLQNDTQAINEGIKVLRKAINMQFIVNGYSEDYNSLNVFFKYDFDYLKVNYNLYRNIEENKREILLRNVYGICKELNIQIIATGVENDDEIEFIKTCDINLVDGPVFGKVSRKPGAAFFKVNRLAGG